jgi:electron transport complex protein RnfE
MLALCPAMAVTTSGTNGLGMGLATTAVLITSNVLVASIRSLVSPQVRIPIFVVLIATLVTLVDLGSMPGCTTCTRCSACSSP